MATYKKISDTEVEITETKEVTRVSTLPKLREKKSAFETQLQQVTLQKTVLEGAIQKLDQDIVEFQALGVLEVADEPK